ncbi:hypothetical protein [Puerhibacterium puerhi]|uniref:hypothetical protein n=1 Tax=Puerhibacterium puerhi TaxID=2692623 RepID=UPI0013572CDE|nr:hypothetical protein [Puerhibacterium puerhi]
MDELDQPEVHEMDRDMIQLRFGDEQGEYHDINARDLAEVLQGLTTLVSDSAKAGVFGDGPPPEVRVRPIKEGSVTVEAVLQWAVDNPTWSVPGATAILGGAGYAVKAVIGTAIKRLRKKPESVERLDTGNYLITWPGEGPEEVSEEVWKLINTPSRRTRKAMAQLQAPMSEDASFMEVRVADRDADSRAVLATPTDVRAEKRDYYAAAATEPEKEPNKDVHPDIEAQLKAINFSDPTQWQVAALGRTKKATIADEEFLASVERGTQYGKNDIFRVTLVEETFEREGRNKIDWTLTKVVRTRRGANDAEEGQQSGAPD